MPDTPAFLKHDRVAYVGSHSFVLLIGVLALTGAATFFHNPHAPAYEATALSPGHYFQSVAYALLGAGGLCVIIGLVLLSLPTEAAGHSLIVTGVVMNGILLARVATLSFDSATALFTIVFTVVCILFRLWALFQTFAVYERWVLRNGGVK